MREGWEGEGMDRRDGKNGRCGRAMVIVRDRRDGNDGVECWWF